MATFVLLTVTCLFFFTCCFSNSHSETFSISCSTQNYPDCVNVTLTDIRAKILCLHLNYYTQLLCKRGHPLPPSQKHSKLSIEELCNQIENNIPLDIEVNNRLNISNILNNKTICIRTCLLFKNFCLSLENLKKASQNLIKSSVGNETKNVSVVTPNKSMSTTLIVTALTTKRQNLTKSSDSKQLTTTSPITAVNITSEININPFNASSDNYKIKNVSTSSVLNNVEKKTTDINLGSSVDGRQDDFNHHEISQSFNTNVQQKEIPNHFPTTSRDEQQKSFDVTNDRNAKQKILLPAEYNETPSSAHFMGYFLTAIVLCIAGYIVFHNKQKIIAFIIEGRNQKRSRRPNSGEYKKLQTNVDDVMSSLEKSTASQNYIY